MTSTKVLTLAVLAVSFLSASSVFADEVSAEDKERAYQLICVPGAELGLPEKEVQEAADFRAFYFNFLKQPETILPVVEELKKGVSGLEGIGLSIQIAATCGATDLLKSDILSRGCKDESGQAVSIAKALEVCGPVNEWISKQGK